MSDETSDVDGSGESQPTSDGHDADSEWEWGKTEPVPSEDPPRDGSSDIEPVSTATDTDSETERDRIPIDLSRTPADDDRTEPDEDEDEDDPYAPEPSSTPIVAGEPDLENALFVIIGALAMILVTVRLIWIPL
ncbi:adhesin [Natrarchaeobius halalkaliphilus]|uniref:Adhesin n=1 Tax=Natrarchaeobius halalkaliphilus TaxID=1679091 RepID=A0A3N6P1S0_9EURY|nr:adhesin [Natrarchaeobius halalkaliphilus]RQG91489.1 adhesin [Natrarchaeobius halalkaliphilus]